MPMYGRMVHAWHPFQVKAAYGSTYISKQPEVTSNMEEYDFNLHAVGGPKSR